MKKYTNKKKITLKRKQRKTKRIHLVRNKKRYLKGGTTIPNNITLPILIDKSNITYSCSPIPGSNS